MAISCIKVPSFVAGHGMTPKLSIERYEESYL